MARLPADRIQPVRHQASVSESGSRVIRAAQIGMLVNAVLALVKLVAGLVGNTYALVADAVESTGDIFASLVVWGGLSVATRDPDEDYPFGYGKAESVAAAFVAIMLLAAAVGIAFVAVREIRTPHKTPAPWTLLVLVAVLLVKYVLFRRVAATGEEAGSTAGKADAWHHLSDAITSAAAFVGISIALWGGAGWEQADDWAALFASAIIFYNGLRLARPAVYDLMDRTPGGEIIEPVRNAAAAVSGVLAVEKLSARKAGLVYYVDIHVQANPQMSLHDAHGLSGAVKSAIRASVPRVFGVLVHMEPFDGSG
ncbi:MAG: cation diffusion facilitator family transporter [Gemmatimonadaceae bacterium]|nr:cation diffusion facilitator family transporter [Gemmatimonadaceae bacterium]